MWRLEVKRADADSLLQSDSTYTAEEVATPVEVVRQDAGGARGIQPGRALTEYVVDVDGRVRPESIRILLRSHPKMTEYATAVILGSTLKPRRRVGSSSGKAYRLGQVLLWAILAGCGGTAPGAGPAASAAPTSRIEADVAWLASPALGGRAAGSPGSAQAALFLAKRYTELGLQGAFPARCDSSPPCAALFAQPFSVESGGASNIAAVLPGADSLLRSTWIVIGAHRDHIGRAARYARDPERGMQVRPGADDNASGTAAVLELARRLNQRPPGRSVMFVHFDAEELGLLGSRVFVREPPMPLDSVMVMINFDMVGRLRKAELTIDVAANGQGFLGLLDSLATTEGILPLFITGLSSRSDHGPFDEVMVPAFALFTGFHADYHTANDIAARVDAAGILKVVDLVEKLVRSAGPRL